MVSDCTPSSQCATRWADDLGWRTRTRDVLYNYGRRLAQAGKLELSAITASATKPAVHKLPNLLWVKSGNEEGSPQLPLYAVLHSVVSCRFMLRILHNSHIQVDKQFRLHGVRQREMYGLGLHFLMSLKMSTPSSSLLHSVCKARL